MTAPRALTTRFLDFWLLGGASILVWLVMILAQTFWAGGAVNRRLSNLEGTALLLALVVNYPHFLISYKLAYTRGRSFILGHWWQLIAVPLGLAAILAAAYAFYDVPVRRLSVVTSASQALSGWGANEQLVSGPRLGDLLFTAAFNLMVFTIGWHYTKQVFGCLMVYAHFDGYPIAAAQRRLMRWAMLTVWVMSFVDNNRRGDWKLFGTFSYSSFDLPDIAAPISELLVGMTFALVLYRVFYVNYKATGRSPSLNLLVPLIALYIWWLPQTRQDEFYFVLTPLFHSLQYLAFAYKVEDTRIRSLRHRAIRATTTAVGAVVAGWLAFVFIPAQLDARLGTFNAWGLPFFLTAAMLFINIHHYFIDSVAWRLKDPPVRAYLLG